MQQPRILNSDTSMQVGSQFVKQFSYMFLGRLMGVSPPGEVDGCVASWRLMGVSAPGEVDGCVAPGEVDGCVGSWGG